MRRAVPCMLLLAVFLLPRSSRSDEFSDFRLPKHSVYGWSGDVLANLGSSRQNTTTLFTGPTRSKTGNGQARIGTQAFRITESDAARTLLRAQVVGAYDWRATDQNAGLTCGQ